MRFFEVNVLSGARLARLCLPAMKRANWGRIIFISSESALQIPVEMIHYGVTKTAQIANSVSSEPGAGQRHLTSGKRAQARSAYRSYLASFHCAPPRTSFSDKSRIAVRNF
jgi:hypothetical protein